MEAFPVLHIHAKQIIALNYKNIELKFLREVIA